MSTLKRSLLAAALGMIAAAPVSYDLTPRRSGKTVKMAKLHGDGKKPTNPPGTKPNRALRRIKGR